MMYPLKLQIINPLTQKIKVMEGIKMPNKHPKIIGNKELEIKTKLLSLLRSSMR